MQKEEKTYMSAAIEAKPFSNEGGRHLGVDILNPTHGVKGLQDRAECGARMTLSRRVMSIALKLANKHAGRPDDRPMCFPLQGKKKGKRNQLGGSFRIKGLEVGGNRDF